MPKFRCHAVVTGGKYLGIIEAATKEEAKSKAFESDEAYVSLCHQCCRHCEDAEVVDVNVEQMEDGEEE